ncbi:hypothetical protein ZWY2020_037104 [Hordeum vulgare]|nr:hypothetical protein ZWY2020_037104 [Hordeum vulgare]
MPPVADRSLRRASIRRLLAASFRHSYKAASDNRSRRLAELGEAPGLEAMTWRRSLPRPHGGHKACRRFASLTDPRDIGAHPRCRQATSWKLQSTSSPHAPLQGQHPLIVYITNLVHMVDCLSWFVGLFLYRKLVQEGHQVLHLKGDRKDFDFVKTSLSAKGFNVVYDINGREATEHSGTIFRFIYCSSAGVYLKSDLLPHFETDAVDQKSRHKGKLETQSLLETSGVNWTSIRPVYIYGPLNYNPMEEWFFHRLKAGRPIPIPNAGNQITQLGHVKDLVMAFIKVLGNPKASKQVYNISGSKYVTFDGIARACAKAGGFPELEIIHYKPKDFDFGKKKAFPFRDQHFFASVEKASKDLGVTPEYDLLDGLTGLHNLDFDRGTFRKEADFTTDDMILGKKLVSI